MGIADELREYARSNGIHCTCDYLAIADRIDTEHQHEMDERADRYSELRVKMNNCYIELPKDADGLPIHIGDKVTLYCRRVYEVDAIFFYENGVSVSYEGESGCGCDSANKFHRYHEQTVEDMLWELLGKITPSMEDKEAVPIVKAYAEKLRLTDDGEEW